MAILDDNIDVDALANELKLLKNISSSFVFDTFQSVGDVGKALFLPHSNFGYLIFTPSSFIKAPFTLSDDVICGYSLSFVHAVFVYLLVNEFCAR